MLSEVEFSILDHKGANTVSAKKKTPAGKHPKGQLAMRHQVGRHLITTVDDDTENLADAEHLIMYDQANGATTTDDLPREVSPNLKSATKGVLPQSCKKVNAVATKTKKNSRAKLEFCEQD